MLEKDGINVNLEIRRLFCKRINYITKQIKYTNIFLYFLYVEKKKKKLFSIILKIFFLKKKIKKNKGKADAKSKIKNPVRPSVRSQKK